jgi:hypothetical protein
MSNEMRDGLEAKVGDNSDILDHPTPRPDPSKDRPERGEHLPTMPDPTKNDPETGEHVPGRIDPTEGHPPQIDDPRDDEDPDVEKKWA